MGISAPIRAEIYKMLLYEQGAMFKPHTDIEKIPGMFGTLVISLPSNHTGGDVVLMIYIRVPASTGSVILGRLALKGPDLTRVAALFQACSGLPVVIFLALVEKMEMGGVYDSYESQYNGPGSIGKYDYKGSKKPRRCIGDVFQSTLAVKIVKDLNDDVVSGEMFINEEHLLEPYVFHDIDPDTEDFQGHTGNTGALATHWYHLGSLVIVPHDSVSDFLSQAQKDRWDLGTLPEAQINWLARRCLKPDAQDYLITAMVNLVEHAALQHGQYSLFETILEKLSHILPSDWYSWLREWLIRNDGEEKALARFSKVKSGLSLAMSSHDSLYHRFESLSHLVPLSTDLRTDAIPTPDPIMDWARQTIRNFLHGYGPLEATIEDGLSMANMALYFDDPILFLTESAIPVFEKQISAPSFRFEVLARLRDLIAEGKLPSEEAMNLCRTMSRLLIASQDFTLLRDADILAAKEKKRAYEPWTTGNSSDLGREPEPATTHQTLGDFFIFLLKSSTETDNLKDQFMTKVIKQADKLPAAELFSMWIPYLRSSVEALQKENVPLTTPLYKKFFSALVLATLRCYLGPEPPKAFGWSVAGVDCPCGNCKKLNAFLALPTVVSARFPTNKNRRFHVHKQIERARIGYTHETDRNTIPNTMVVTKTIQPGHVKLQNWRARRKQCAKAFGEFGVERLKTLLGSSYVEVERLGPRPARTTTSQSPVVGKKRAAAGTFEVIDLTSD
ncbi:hypothetical protein FLONG3_2245 [Fusarium longipes]|uniref:Uncharacterized protein n=1 Tax=Fusarium longipes TaxID=694270 RepID=A0A395T4Q4_9HYPO|nr:hypothetical protein FLONG3_2245 [Fusarium longipes]